jgi:MOSC domain-containing protein YiiM
LRNIAQNHDGMAGVYGVILVEGTLRVGDPVELVD